MLSVEDLKELLTSQGLSNEYTDIQLQSMIDEALNYIIFAAEIDIFPQSHVDIEPRFKGYKHLLNYYPVEKVESITIQDKPITEYELDKEIGIIYFPEFHHGMLKIEYSTCMSEEDIKTYVNPVLGKLILYNLNNDPTHDATTYKEGEVSITLDPALTDGAVVNQMINTLKNRFQCKVDLI